MRPRFVRLALLTGGLLLSAAHACAQGTGLDKLRQDGEQKTDEFLQQAILNKQNCRLPEGYLLVSKNGLNALDAKALDDAVKRLNDEIDKLAKKEQEGRQALDQLQKEEKEAILRGLAKGYWSAIGPRDRVEVGLNVTVVTPTLFGTFVQSYERVITPGGGPQQLKVTFTPTVFAADAKVKGVKLRPKEYRGGSVPQPLQVTELKVTRGTATQNFKMGVWEDIDLKQSTSWAWEVQAAPGFQKGEFEIVFEAEDDSASGTGAKPVEVAMPFGLEAKPPEPFPWTTVVMVVVPAILTFIGGYILKKYVPDAPKKGEGAGNPKT